VAESTIVRFALPEQGNATWLAYYAMSAVWAGCD